MKKNKKNKIFAVAVISAILCGLFCITAFAWNENITVLPFNQPSISVDGYTLITVTNSGVFTSTENISGDFIVFDPSLSSYTSSSTIFVSRDSATYTISLTFATGIPFVSTGGTNRVYNGGSFYCLNSDVSSVVSFLEAHNYTVSVFDPIGDIFDNVSHGVTGTLNIASSTASLLTTNTILLIMCVALPLVSFGVGLLIRLKVRS